MKIYKFLSLVVVVAILGGCKEKEKEPLVIPTVDVENLHINLPEKPQYNVGNIRSDDNFDYLDFYEVSDFHGAVNFEQHSDGNYIGLAKLSSYLSSKRQSNAGGTVVLSSGDMFQGSAESNLTRGYMVNYCMNYMGFDSMTLGNHEFDWTDTWIRNNANLAYNGEKIPYLAANLFQKSTGNIPDFVKKSIILERGNYKIGIIGTIGSELENTILYSCVSDYDFKEEKSIVENEAKNLREQGCDVVIWSTHNGVDIIPIVDGVDGIFGGHAHVNKRTTKGEAPCVATKNYGSAVAHIEIKINKNTKVVESGEYGVDENPTALEGLSDDNNVLNIMNQFSNEINNIKNIKLGTCSERLEIENELKNIAVDAMQISAKKAVKENNIDIEENKIIAAYHNISGGIRSNIEAGDITYGDVYKPFPFDNEICLYKINGKVYKNKCINNDFASWAIWKNFSKRTELNDNENYYLVVTDFIALSENYLKGVFPEITEADLIRTGKTVRDEIAQYIYAEDKIDSSKYGSNVECFKVITRA